MVTAGEEGRDCFGARREQFDEPGNGNGDDDDEDEGSDSGYAGCLNVMTMLIL